MSVIRISSVAKSVTIGLCGLLTACTTTAPIGIQVREVEVPTPVACIQRDQLPVEPARVGSTLTGNAVVDLAIVSASALELRKWGQEQAAILEGCALN